MKSKLFKEFLFQKVISGEVTQFCEVVNPPKGAFGGIIVEKEKSTGIVTKVLWCDEHECTQNPDGSERIIKPRYKVGETVYLKEPYFVDFSGHLNYKCDEFNVSLPANNRWENLFMPEKYARYFIKISDVKCERVQNINDEDCLECGVQELIGSYNRWGQPYFLSGVNKNGILEMHKTPQESNAELIRNCTWLDNTFVWRYEFKLSYKSFDEILEDKKDILQQVKTSRNK